jgi:ABC-2 type transport system ATP-binding protein
MIHRVTPRSVWYHVCINMGSFISVRDLSKTFKIYKRGSGLAGAIRYLFSRSYESVHAVDSVNFDIEAGESVGYIGRNGAGKSTTIKMLTGILVPTSGSVVVDGLVPYKARRQNAKKIGVVFGHRSHLRWDIPVRESYRLLQAVYEVPQKRFDENLDMFCELLELRELLGRPVRKLSLGQRMRCDLAAAFLHNPSVVYLDEPTIGLDILVKEQVRTFISRLNEERGTTVLLTTHDLRDIERLCKRILIIDEGRIVFDGSLAEIKTNFGASKSISFEIGTPLDAAAIPKLSLPGSARIESSDAHNVRISLDTTRDSTSTVVREVLIHCDVTDISIEETNIEEIVKRLYRGDLDT